MISESVEIVGGVVRREFKIKAGVSLPSHRHPYDHLSFLLSGIVILDDGTGRKQLTGPRAVVIKADTEHWLHAITDCVWDCVHSLDVAEKSGDELLMKGIA